jgi:transposase-like protein
LDEALCAVKAFAAKYGKTFPAACGILAKDLGDCLTFYRFPQEHWKRLRTSNVIERAFGEVRRRTDVIRRFPGEASAEIKAHGAAMIPAASRVLYIGRLAQTSNS